MKVTEQSRALSLFTDRDEPRKLIQDFLKRIKSGRSHEARQILSFYGVGGVGKSELLRKALADFRIEEKRDLFALSECAISLAQLDLDSGTIHRDTPIPTVLGRLRAALHAAGVQTPLFDYLCLCWWRNEHPQQELHWRGRSRTVAKDAGDAFIGGMELLESLYDALKEVIPFAKGVQGAIKFREHLGAWWDTTTAKQRFADGRPDHWPAKQQVERMGSMLGRDLLAWTQKHPQGSVCITLDGFERIQSTHRAHDVQWAIQTFFAEVLECTDLFAAPDGKPIKGRIGFIVLGREKLRWSEIYGRESHSIRWNAAIEDHAELLGLTQADALWFLKGKVAPWERAQGNVGVADLIEENADAILEVSCERRPGYELGYLPYCLDLSVQFIRKNVSSFNSSDLGHTPGELSTRFIRSDSLTETQRTAFQALALAIEFDEATLRYLRINKQISGLSDVKFHTLVGDDWSFVLPISGRPGFYAFHRHMQDSLIASLSDVSDDRAWAMEVLDALLERQLESARFITPAQCGASHLAAFERGMNMVRAAAKLGPNNEPLLFRGGDVGIPVQWGLRFDALFSQSHFAGQRVQHLHWLVDFARRVLGDEHPDTWALMRKLGIMLTMQGLHADARATR